MNLKTNYLGFELSHPLMPGASPLSADRDSVRRLEDAGVTHLQTMPWAFYGGAGETLDEKRNGLQRFADDVIAKMP